MRIFGRILLWYSVRKSKNALERAREFFNEVELEGERVVLDPREDTTHFKAPSPYEIVRGSGREWALAVVALIAVLLFVAATMR